MLIRRESGGDVCVVRAVTEAAFGRPDAAGRETVEARLPYLQVRTFACYQPTVRGAFRYAEPFDRT